MDFRKLPLNKNFIVFIGVFLSLCICLYFLVGFFASNFFTAERIDKLVKKQTGLNIVLKNSKIRTLPNLSIFLAASDIGVIQPDTNQYVFSAKNASLQIKILPLLFKQIDISLLSSHDLQINVNRDKNGRFNFEKYINGTRDFPINFKFKRSCIKFDKLSFNFIDEKNERDIVFKSNNFFADVNNRPQSVKTDIDATLQICDTLTDKCSATNFNTFISTRLPANKYLDSKDTNFDVIANNVDLKLFEPYFNEFLKFQFSEFDFKTDILFKKNSTNSEYSLKFRPKIINLDFILNEKKSAVKLLEPSDLNFNFIAKKNFADIITSTFKSKDINVTFDGKIKNYKTKKPQPDVRVNVVNSDFMRFIKLIPAGLVVYKTDLINELINANPHARVDADVVISGNYLQPNINGKAQVYDVYLFSRPIGFDTAHVDCDFIGDKVNVDVYVPGPNNQYVSVKGYSEIYGKQSGNYEVISSDSVDLAFAHKYLVPVQRVIGFKLGPVPFMKLAGKGKIHIKAKGTIYDAIVDGKFFAHNITASMQGLNTVLKNGKIELDFNGKVINILNTSAKMNDGNFTLSGFADDYNNLNVMANITDINALHVLNIAKTSPIIKPFSGDLSFIKSANGKTDLIVKFDGKAKSLEGMNFLNDIKPSGEIILKNVNAVFIPNFVFTDSKGKISFDDDFKVDINALFKGAKSSISGVISPLTKDLSDKDAKLKLNLKGSINSLLFSQLCDVIKAQNYFENNDLKFLLTSTPVKSLDFIFNTEGKINGVIPADYNKIDFSKLSVEGSFTPLNSNKSENISFISGKYFANDNKVNILNSHVKFFGADIYTNGSIDNFLKKPKANLKVRANSLSLNNLQSIVQYTDIMLIKTLLADFTDYKGFLDLNLNIKKNLPYGKLSFNDVGMYNKKQQIPLLLKSGGIKFAGDRIFIEALNFNYGNTPIYFNASAKDYLTKKPAFNAMFSTNLDEKSADMLINPYLTYPFKIKGEVRVKGRIKGGINNYSLISYLTLPKDTDISYMGANVGDLQYDREFEIKSDFTKNTAKVQSAKYVKYIPSQNNKPTAVTMLKAYGRVDSHGNDLFFNNFKIETPNPVTAKIFNLLFKKSVLKQGLFTCDLNLNGNVLLPHATGKINFRNINIPLYSTKINDMDCEVTKNKINAVLQGKSFDSDVEIRASVQNKQTLPVVVEGLSIKSKKTSLSQLIEGISQLPKGSSDIVPGQPIVLKPKDLIVISGHASADEVELYDIKATNLTADFSNPTGDIFNINNMQFNIAGGKVVSKGNFDIASMLFDLDSIVEDCDANTLSANFLGLQNQIYGRTNARINLKGKIPENAQDIKLVSGTVNFSVNNGKMPKLGSLEYLLRAGNLIKSGILGLTLNNLIEVLTPYKTGEFSAIKGNFNVHDGKISKLEIFSRGNNLSLFIYGGYDIINDNADIEILGRLSKKVSNVLGAAGNASLNTLLSTITGNKIKEGAKSQIIENVNKIPLIEISGDDYRLFLAKIKGKLNSDDYVKSFNWLN